jgi:hypothetical protein
MANILFLVHKKRFDLTLARYLKAFHNVFLMTSDPMVGLFLSDQGEKFAKLYDLKPSSSDLQLTAANRCALCDTELYSHCHDDRVKRALERLCATYMDFLDRFIQSNDIRLVFTQEKVFLDVACLTEVCKERKIPVCYLGAGFFRGETTALSFERLHLTNPDIWERRYNLAKQRPVVPSARLSEVEFTLPVFQKTGTWRALWQKIRYQRNPLWTGIHPDMKPSRTFWQEQQHRRKKKKAKKTTFAVNIDLPEPFLLLTLQGNEICRQVSNILGIRDMEHLTASVFDAVQVVNRSRKVPLHLVVKEHPSRPQVLGREFRASYPTITYLSKYPIDRLLTDADIVVTFNSLSGFEALLRYRPVVTLGPAFYTQPGLVFRVERLETLAGCICQAQEAGCDKQAVDEFAGFLKKHYDIRCPGFSRKSVSVDGLKMIASKAEGVLSMARNMAVHPGAWSHGQ